MSIHVKEFYDNFDIRLIKDFGRGNERVIAALRQAAESLLESGASHILDIGCGIGWSSYELIRLLPEASIHGVDLSERLIEVANKLFSHPQINFSTTDLTNGIAFGEKKFDGVLMVDVFEHIPAVVRSKFYQDLKNVLSEEFCIVLTCPTVLHQAHLRKSNPDGLQPVDEDVDAAVLLEFSHAVGGDLIYFSYKSIWRTNDYLHAVISNKCSYREKRDDNISIQLLSSKERRNILSSAGFSGLVPRARFVSKVRNLFKGKRL